MALPDLLHGADRALVIGLDCAAPALVFERWRASLPHLSALMERGCWGPLRSCHPPITVPAWRVMASGHHAGRQGVYGFRNRPPERAYDDLSLAHSGTFQAPSIWDTLADEGLRTTLIGLPGTWPPLDLHGACISGPLTPDLEAACTSPASLRERVLRIAPGYGFDIDDFRNLAPEALLLEATRITQARFDVIDALAADDDWNLLWCVEIALDRLHHALWHAIDPDHPKAQDAPHLRDGLRDYYALLDARIGRLIEACDDGATAFAVVSDHGARTMRGGICVNVWLQRHGYLTLKPGAPDASRLDPAWIDWSKTRAWAWGGYVARIFVNQRGREPEGIVDPEETPALLSALTDLIHAIPGPDGAPLQHRVERPGDLYDARLGQPPDLLAYLGNLDWRALDAITPDVLHYADNDTGPDGANHDWDGIFIAAGAGIQPCDTPLEGARLLDVAPWLERLLLGAPDPDAWPVRTSAS